MPAQGGRGRGFPAGRAAVPQSRPHRPLPPRAKIKPQDPPAGKPAAGGSSACVSGHVRQWREPQRAPVATSQPSLLDVLGAATRPEWPPHRRGAAHLPRPALRGPALRKLPSKGTLVRSLGKCSQSRGSRGGGGSCRAPSLSLYCSSVRAFFQPGCVDADTASNSLRSEIILPCPAQLLSCSPRVAMAPGAAGRTYLGIQALLRRALG